MRIGPTEIFMILIVVLIIFGPKNLPKLGKMFGQTMKGFKEGIDDDDDPRRPKRPRKTTRSNLWPHYLSTEKAPRRWAPTAA